MARAVKIFGERNCGTRWLTALVRDNVDAHVLPGSVPKWLRWLDVEPIKDAWFRATRHQNLGWKHATAGAELTSMRSDVAVITISKHPYAFLLSLFDRPHHLAGEAPARFEDFVRMPWPTLGREGCAGRVLPDPVALWNQKNRSYLALVERGVPCVNLRYEDLLAEPEQVLATACTAMGLSQRPGGFRKTLASTKGDADRSYATYREHYLSERWRDRLSAEAVAHIASRLDAEVVERLGYALGGESSNA